MANLIDTYSCLFDVRVSDLSLLSTLLATEFPRTALDPPKGGHSAAAEELYANHYY